MNARGDVLDVEEERVLTSLPAAVQAGLAQTAGTGKIVKVESLTKQNHLVAYEAMVQSRQDAPRSAGRCRRSETRNTGMMGARSNKIDDL